MFPPFTTKQAADLQNLANLVRGGLSWKAISVYLSYAEKLVDQMSAVHDRARADGLLSKIHAHRDLHVEDCNRVKGQLALEIEKLAEFFEEAFSQPLPKERKKPAETSFLTFRASAN